MCQSGFRFADPEKGDFGFGIYGDKVRIMGKHYRFKPQSSDTRQHQDRYDKSRRPWRLLYVRCNRLHRARNPTQDG